MPSGNRAMRRSKRTRASASFIGLRPASPRASRLAAKASRKRGTKCELKLRGALERHGLKFKTNVSTLPGCPDLVFPRQKIAVFADGDFWHGRKLASRLESLSRAHNSDYWIKKIRSNVLRDRRVRWAATDSDDTTLSLIASVVRTPVGSGNPMSSVVVADCRSVRCSRTHPLEPHRVCGRFSGCTARS
jgi:DNA mismatch endonuclease Vsr